MGIQSLCISTQQTSYAYRTYQSTCQLNAAAHMKTLEEDIQQIADSTCAEHGDVYDRGHIIERSLRYNQQQHTFDLHMRYHCAFSPARQMAHLKGYITGSFALYGFVLGRRFDLGMRKFIF